MFMAFIAQAFCERILYVNLNTNYM